MDYAFCAHSNQSAVRAFGQQDISRALCLAAKRRAQPTLSTDKNSAFRQCYSKRQLLPSSSGQAAVHTLLTGPQLLTLGGQQCRANADCHCAVCHGGCWPPCVEVPCVNAHAISQVHGSPLLTPCHSSGPHSWTATAGLTNRCTLASLSANIY